MRDRTAWGPPVTMLAAVPLLLAPWWLPAVVHDSARSLLIDTGRLPGPKLGFDELVAGRLPGDLGAPWWLGIALVVMAVLALIPSRTRIPVLVVWIVALVAAATSAALGAVLLDLPVGEARPGLGFFLVVLRGAFIVAAFIAIHGLATRARRTGTTLRRLVPLTLTAVAAVVPVLGLAWFVLEGPGELTDERDTGIPAYMVQDALRGPAHGILVIRGSVDEGLSYSVRRGDGVTIGEDEILAATPTDADFDAMVQTLTSRPRAAVVAQLAADGIQYVVLPSPADGTVAAGLDASGGLDQASAEDRSTRAWQVSRPVDEGALDGPTSWLRVGLLVLQGVAMLVVLVLCAPTQRASAGAPRGGRFMSRQVVRGRRAALPPPERVARGLRARLNLTAVLAVLLPALTIGALVRRGRRHRRRDLAPAARDGPQPLDPDLPEQPRRPGRGRGRERDRSRRPGGGHRVGRCDDIRGRAR